MSSASAHTAGIAGAVGARVTVDLTETTDAGSAYLLSHLDLVPDGATVVIAIGDRGPDHESVDLLTSHLHRLRVVFDGAGNSSRLGDWLDAVHTGTGAGA